MRRYQLLPHTADFRLKAEGDTFEELFTAAMAGMFEFVKKSFCPPAGDRPKGDQNFPISENIKISSIDITALLVDFLSVLLTLSQEKKVVFCRVKFLKLTDTEIEAEVFGAKVDGFDEDIKAVTYHEANVVKNARGAYETIIVFDI